MDHEYEADLLTLLDDEGQEHEFEIIDELENDDGHFLALVPTQQEPDEIASDAETYYIFEVIEEDGEEQLQEVDDDALLERDPDLAGCPATAGRVTELFTQAADTLN